MVLVILLNIKITFPVVFSYKLVCVDDKCGKDVVLYRGKNAVYKFIQSIFNEYSYCTSVMKKHFNKNLVMTVDKEEEFKKRNICWICGKLIKMIKTEIIVIRLVNIEVLLIGVAILILKQVKR